MDFIVHVSSSFLQSTLHCSRFISFLSLHTSLIMFHFYFVQSTVHFIHFTYHSPSRSCLPYIVVSRWYGHSTSLSVSLFQPILTLEINDLRVSLDKFIILDRFSLLEAEMKDQRNTKLLNVTLWNSLFMFHLISFSPHFIVHVLFYFLHSTIHCSCFIFISFSPQSISFISPTTVHVIHIYLIWLYSYDMVIQPHCQFHFSTNPDSEN